MQRRPVEDNASSGVLCSHHLLQGLAQSPGTHAALQGGSQAEWKQAHGAAMLLGGRGAELEELMGRAACLLVMEYVPGQPLFQAPQPFAPGQVLRTAEDLGRHAPRRTHALLPLLRAYLSLAVVSRRCVMPAAMPPTPSCPLVQR